MNDELNRKYQRKVEPCPFFQFYGSKREKSRRRTFTSGDSSDFYRCCQYGFIEPVRTILKEAAAGQKPTIEELSALQPNGSTALHAATYYGHLDIVKLLLDHGFPRTTLNRYGKQAHEEAQTSEMEQLFNRPESTNRFHELNASHTMLLYLSDDTGTNTNSNTRSNYVHSFTTEEEVLEYSLNQETATLWLKAYNWFSHTFKSWLHYDNFSVDDFDLEHHDDFRQFIEKLPNPRMSRICLDFVQEAHRKNSIEPLITLYSSEEAGLYGPLNKQLACVSSEAETRPHICDRFAMEFYLRKNELKQRAFTGTVYRGATLSIDDIAVYESALRNHSTPVVGLKAFTSTSMDPYIALCFAWKNPAGQRQKHVLFIFEIDKASSTVFAIEDVSIYSYEREVLILPGTLFVVTEIEEDVNLNIVRIVLRHWKVSFSLMTKLKHTFKSGQKSVID